MDFTPHPYQIRTFFIIIGVHTLYYWYGPGDKQNRKNTFFVFSRKEIHFQFYILVKEKVSSQICLKLSYSNLLHGN